MTRRMRWNHRAALTANVAPAAGKSEKTLAQLAWFFDVQPNQTINWKAQFREGAPGVFGSGASASEAAPTVDMDCAAEGLPPRPKFQGRPSGIEQSTSKPLGKNGRKRGRGSKINKLTVTSQLKLKA
jgi:hypothetical protein